MNGRDGYVFSVTTSNDENYVGLSVDITRLLKMLKIEKTNIKYIRLIKNYSITLIKFIRLFNSLKINRHNHDFWWVISENSQFCDSNVIESIITGNKVNIANNTNNTNKNKNKNKRKKNRRNMCIFKRSKKN